MILEGTSIKVYTCRCLRDFFPRKQEGSRASKYRIDDDHNNNNIEHKTMNFITIILQVQ